MPNRCENVVTIHAKPEQIKEILDAIRWEWLFQHFIPWTDEVRKDRDMELLYWGNWTSWRKEHNFPDMWLDWKKAWYSECPYHQTWYNRQCNNWWAKRDFHDPEYTNYDYEEWWDSIEIFYESPWSPHLVWREQISEKLKCEVNLQFSEPGNCFSWEYTWQDWEEVQCADYDDAYYWNWKSCCICNCEYDNECDDDWYDDAHTLCYICAEDLSPKELKKYESK